MAVVSLKDISITSFSFPESWRTERMLGTPITSLFPGKSTSLNQVYRSQGQVLYGDVTAIGSGKVKVVYPVSTDNLDYIKLPNVEFMFIPYLLLRALPLQSFEFKGWYSGDILLSKETLLVLGRDSYVDVVQFQAIFQ